MAREVRIHILGDGRDFSRAVDRADRDASRLDGAMGRVGRGASLMGAAVVSGVAVAGGALAFGAMQAIDAAEEARAVARQTDSVLASMGATAWTSASQVSEFASQLSALTAVDDELIQSGQNVLLTFGNVQNRVGDGKDIFDRATAAALDMSTAMQMDMSSAALQVGKALNDPIDGISKLGRAGIDFSDQQKEQIRTMQEAGDIAGAQAVILAELERQFGGSAAGQATAGKRLSVMWGNLQEQLGEKLLPIFEKVVNWLISVMPGALATAERWFNQFQAGVAVVVAWWEANWPKIQEVTEAVMAKVTEVISVAIGYIRGAWETFGDDLIRIATGVWQMIQNTVETVMGVIQGIINVVMGIIHGDWSQVWEGIKGIALSVWEGIKGGIQAALNFIQGIIGAFGETVGGMFHRIWDGIKEGFRSAVNWIIDRWNGLEFTFGGADPLGAFGPSIPGFTLGLPEIPRLASGGIVTQPTLALIGEAGPEAVVPLDRGMGGDVHVQVILDGNAIVDSLVRYNRNSGPIRIKVA